MFMLREVQLSGLRGVTDTKSILRHIGSSRYISVNEYRCCY
jgi:hypothetical protein